MAWTSHGHHIAGTDLDPDFRPNQRMRCGGPNLCGKCSSEQARAHQRLREAANLQVEKHYHRKPARVTAVFWDGTVEGAGPILNWLRSNVHPESRLQPQGELLLIGVPGDAAIYMEPRTFFVDHGDKVEVITEDRFHKDFELED